MTFPAMEMPDNSKADSDAAPESSGEDLLKLAESDPVEVVKRLHSEWNKSWDTIKNIDAQWRVNLARSSGYIGARLDKVEDRQECFIPLGAVPSIVGLNKAERLSANLKSNIFPDPAILKVVPESPDDSAADQATFASRILADETSEGRCDLGYGAAEAFDVAKNFGSGFIHLWPDPIRRGPEPVRIKAHPAAISEQDPLAEQIQEKEAAEPILRYVAADGGLTDDPHGGVPLKRQFLPGMRYQVLSGRHVRFLPNTSTDIWDARGVLVGFMLPLGIVKTTFPSVAKLKPDELEALVSYRPTRAKDLLPPEQRKALNAIGTDDNTLVFVLMRYFLPTPTNQTGSYLAAVGENHLAHFGPWWDEKYDLFLDLPLTQIKHYNQAGNGYGAGSNERLGPGNEIAALMLEFWFMHLDRVGDSKVYVPTTSNLRPEQLEAETHRYLPVAPGGEPKFEEIPPLPSDFKEMYALMNQEMDAESGLQGSGQAQQSSNVTSARQFTAELSQVRVLLSELKTNAMRGIARGGRIILQQIRAYYDIPQMLKWEGDDGGYHTKEWSGADLVGMSDVRVAPDSFTGKLPEQKAARARQLYLEDKALTPQEYRRIIQTQYSGELTLEIDPHYQRVKRQIARWEEGPPEGWQVATAPETQPDPMTGQPLPTGQVIPSPATDPVLTDIFRPRLCDAEPQAAQTRLTEFGRAMTHNKFDKFPRAWQQGLELAYQVTQQNLSQAAGQNPDTQVAQIKASTELQKQKIKSQTDLQSAELNAQAQVLDVKAAQASRGNPVTT